MCILLSGETLHANYLLRHAPRSILIYFNSTFQSNLQMYLANCFIISIFKWLWYTVLWRVYSLRIWKSKPKKNSRFWHSVINFYACLKSALKNYFKRFSFSHFHVILQNWPVTAQYEVNYNEFKMKINAFKGNEKKV